MSGFVSFCLCILHCRRSQVHIKTLINDVLRNSVLRDIICPLLGINKTPTSDMFRNEVIKERQERQ